MPANCRAKRPGASARRPGNACRTGERERESGGAAEEEDKFSAESGALDLGVPAADLAAAFAFETTSTRTPAAQPDIGEGTEKENSIRSKTARQELQAKMVTDRSISEQEIAQKVSQ